MIRVRGRINETDLSIQTDLMQAARAALTTVQIHRIYLETYIRHNPLFLASLEPVEVEANAPEVVKRMAEAALVAKVGPMAAVAGALADLAVEAMEEVGAKVRVVENGGEIAAVSEKDLKVGVYAGASPLSGKIGFHISHSDMPIGIGTSSATVGHAINFGEADSVTVFTNTATLADAAATAISNAVTGRDLEASIQKGLEVAKTIPGVRGAFIIRDKHVGSVGKIPEPVKITGKLDVLQFKSLYVLPVVG